MSSKTLPLLLTHSQKMSLICGYFFRKKIINLRKCVSILFHHLVYICVLHISYVYAVTLSNHHSIFVVFTNRSPSHSFHLPQSISFIQLIIVHHFHIYFHFHIYNIWSHLYYIIIQPYFHDLSTKKISLKIFIHELTPSLYIKA